jgi:hypothetical protein
LQQVEDLVVEAVALTPVVLVQVMLLILELLALV